MIRFDVLQLLNKQKCFWSYPFIKHSQSYCSNSCFSSENIRSAFINYFQNHDHKFVASSKVYSPSDNSLLFINAGMNQFKPIFLETDDYQNIFPFKKAVNSQKCIRVGGKHNDLDVVGKDLSHHTFFEMLGSWSFGDYFKKDACFHAWEVLTKVYKLPVENLYVTYFGGCTKLGLEPDLETRDIWGAVGVSKDRIFPFDAKHNFWEMGELGPCGPCTEIHYDQIGNRYVPQEINVDGSNVIEIWNLVFMQYNKTGPNELQPLKKFHVDTGMGLERITAVLQGKFSNYDTDLFQPIIKKIEELGNCPKYQGKIGDDDIDGIDAAYRIISDHVRMITVAIGDGIHPGPRNRDLILKRLLHRALKAGSEVLHLHPMFMEKLVLVVIEKLKGAYPCLLNQQSNIIDAVNNAESAYYNLLHKGDSIVKKTVEKMSPSDQMFPINVALHLLFHLGYPKDRLSHCLSQFNKVFDQKETDRFLKEKHSRPPQQMIDKINRKKQFEMSLLQNLIALKFEKTKIFRNLCLCRKENGIITFSPIQVKLLGIFNQNGDLIMSNSACDSAYLLFDKTCFFHPHNKALTSVGKLKISNDNVYVIDEVLSIKDWVLHRVTWSKELISEFELKKCFTLYPISDHWLPYLRAFKAGLLINSLNTNLINGKKIQKIGGLEQDKLRIEISGVINDDGVLKLESSINQLFQKTSSDYDFHSLQHASDSEIGLLPQDLKPFLIVKHRTEAKSRTHLHCVTGSRAETSFQVLNKLHSKVSNLVREYESDSNKNLNAIESLQSQVGNMIAVVNKSEISFVAKAQLKKTLKFLSSKLNKMKHKRKTAPI